MNSMTLIRTRLAAFASLTLCAALAGCGGSGSNTTSGSNSAGTSESTSGAPTPAPVGEATNANTPATGAGDTGRTPGQGNPFAGGTQPSDTSTDGGMSIETISIQGQPPGEAVEGEPIETESGLRYYVLEEGDGPSPENAETAVTVHYTGWLASGQKFDSSHDRGEPADFVLGGVIPGWTEGVMSMKVGEKRKLIIPGSLGYGPNGSPQGGIPPNATLIFDVELLDIDRYARDPETWPGETYEGEWNANEFDVRWGTLAEGEGEQTLKADDAARVMFEGWQVDGTQFQDPQQIGRPNELYLPSLPVGWAEAMIGMTIGEKRKVILPYEQGFGLNGDPRIGIKPKATLVFDIELLDINHFVGVPEPLPGEAVDGESVVINDALSYYVLAEGSGEQTVADDSIIRAHLHGWTNDGALIDQLEQAAQPIDAPASQLFEGWIEALRGMKPGGKRKLVYEFAASQNDAGPIPGLPPRATLVFDIELVTIDPYASIPETLPGEAVTGDPVTLDSGVLYYDTAPGSGDAAVTSETTQVTATIATYLNDGTPVAQISSPENPVPLNLAQFPGLREGVIGMKPGGSRKIIIPASVPFAAVDTSGVLPPRAVLIIDIGLQSISE